MLNIPRSISAYQAFTQDMQVLHTLEQLDAKLAECDAAAKISDEALRRVFSTFRMNFSKQLPRDPFSVEYRTFQLALYERLSGGAYNVANEKSKFNVEEAERRPFPYYTGSCATVGVFGLRLGALLRTIRLNSGARVLDLGAGFGNTTIEMALTGLKVTALDIESDFCDLLRKRAIRHEVNIDVVNADFMWIESAAESFDGAVFFESFHHCLDHIRLFDALQNVIKPGGRIYFGSEPILRDFPIPWGLRMDGEALWAIRSNKWLELGFSESYFRAALARAGWAVTKHVISGLDESESVWVAYRPHEAKVDQMPSAPSAARKIARMLPPSIRATIRRILPDVF